MLKVENLQKSFFTEEIETVALNGVSFEVKEREHVFPVFSSFAAEHRTGSFSP